LPPGEGKAGYGSCWKESLNGSNWELTTGFRITAWQNLAEAPDQLMEFDSLGAATNSPCAGITTTGRDPRSVRHTRDETCTDLRVWSWYQL